MTHADRVIEAQAKKILSLQRDIGIAWGAAIVVAVLLLASVMCGG